MTLSPVQRYRLDLATPGFASDPAQARAVAALEDLYQRLVKAPAEQPVVAATRKTLGQRLLGYSSAPAAAVVVRPAARGMYLWGGVGRGKTYLMDCFFESLPDQRKRRVHFHRFMRGVHQDLRGIRDEQRPLARVAERMAAEATVLCLDEFHVSDITDAMLLAGLLEALFAAGVVLVTTSNEAPRDLYRNGLQRARFLPAIGLLERHCQVLHLDSPVDYRLRTLERASLYFTPPGAASDAAIAALIHDLAGQAGVSGLTLMVEERPLPARSLAPGVVWFDFPVLCAAPRAAADYIEIGRCFHTVVISDIPQLDASQDDEARRLMIAVDEFYDRNVKLVLSASVPPALLYAGERLRGGFARTVSRLLEMQSHDYLAREHRSD